MDSLCHIATYGIERVWKARPRTLSARAKKQTWAQHPSWCGQGEGFSPSLSFVSIMCKDELLEEQCTATYTWATYTWATHGPCLCSSRCSHGSARACTPLLCCCSRSRSLLRQKVCEDLPFYKWESAKGNDWNQSSEGGEGRWWQP